VVAQRDWPKLTADQFQQVFDDQAKLGYGPVMIAATGSFSNPLFAAVFQPQNPIPLSRHRLHSGDASDLGTIQGMNAKAKSEGLVLRWAASYGDAGNPGFAAIWVPNTGHVLWNNDGLLDDAATYQARFNAETTAWCRPALVTLDGDNRYMSLFVDNEVGPWVARHNMTPDGYQTEFNTWTGKSFFPVCVQAAGSSGPLARFAALFVQSENTIAKQFHATGPVANADIDNVNPPGNGGFASPSRLARHRPRDETRLRARLYDGGAGLACRAAHHVLPHGERLQDGHRACLPCFS